MLKLKNQKHTEEERFFIFYSWNGGRLIVFKTRIEFSTDRRFVFMSDVIGNPEYPKVKVIRERTPTKIEEKINDLVARGFELRGQVEFGVLDPKLQGGGERYVATMVKTS